MGIHPYAGAGMGVLSTWGTPEWRLVAGVRLVPSELADGIRGEPLVERYQRFLFEYRRGGHAARGAGQAGAGAGRG